MSVLPKNPNNNNNTLNIDKNKETSTPSPSPPPPLVTSNFIEQKLVDRIYDYDYREVHKDLENGICAGGYGADLSCYWALAEKKYHVDLLELQKNRKKSDEHLVKEMQELLEHKDTQKYWYKISTFDPFGMTATQPTIAATKGCCRIIELNDVYRDGVIVDETGGINVIKASIQYVWNLPALASRLGFLTEKDLREGLYKYTQNPKLLDSKIRSFLPPVGGLTAYIFGDPRKLRDPKAEVAVRVHDECNGSDVFGTDICTCRPYLMFALKGCIECAQRGGVGVCVYFRKEGRSLGEVTKFRVYNARKNQKGGDTAEKYFFQTESIAGIVDARFQSMMPDILHWFGIYRIDWLLSMSSDKYEGIVSHGIQVIQRVALPDIYVPKGATVEISAKVMAGYHSDTIKKEEVIDELRDLRTVRKRCKRVFKLAQKNQLLYWNLHIDKFDDCVKEVLTCIKHNYPNGNVPLHTRFRHFDNQALESLFQQWNFVYVDKAEQVRRLVDLITISVLLDAGAGDKWHYIDNESSFSRSEGIAHATFNMFRDGFFSSDIALKTRVNALGLKNITLNNLKIGFQISHNNPMVGLEGRLLLMQRLGEALETHHEFFGSEVYRPGYLLDYLLLHANQDNKVSVHVLWRALVIGLESIWPENLSGVRRGDVWIHNSLKVIGQPGSDFVPFHKLLQWLCYSLMEAFQYYGLEFTDTEDMTALAEYRNGGLLIDTGVLSLKEHVDKDRNYDIGSELIVEWRAMTVILIDMIAERIRGILKKNVTEFPLSRLLEGGTWRAGREIAARLRHNAVPPIHFRSDGTVF